ncbi:hypothetical protein Dimus_007294 [Dionaea muscipula]
MAGGDGVKWGRASVPCPLGVFSFDEPDGAQRQIRGAASGGKAAAISATSGLDSGGDPLDSNGDRAAVVNSGKSSISAKSGKSESVAIWLWVADLVEVVSCLDGWVE